MRVSEQYLEAYRALRHSAGAVVTGRDVIEVRGDDAASFLQGQLSADVAALAPGDVVGSLLLQPDGKLLCLVRVSRAGPDRFVCDLAAGAGEAALARLERFKLRVAVDLELRRLTMLAVRGPAAPSMPVVGADSPEPGATGDSLIDSDDIRARSWPLECGGGACLGGIWWPARWHLRRAWSSATPMRSRPCASSRGCPPPAAS